MGQPALKITEMDQQADNKPAPTEVKSTNQDKLLRRFHDPKHNMTQKNLTRLVSSLLGTRDRLTNELEAAQVDIGELQGKLYTANNETLLVEKESKDARAECREARTHAESQTKVAADLRERYEASQKRAKGIQNKLDYQRAKGDSLATKVAELTDKLHEAETAGQQFAIEVCATRRGRDLARDEAKRLRRLSKKMYYVGLGVGAIGMTMAYILITTIV